MLHSALKKKNVNGGLEHKRFFLNVGWFGDLPLCVVQTCSALFSLRAACFDALLLLSHAWQG